MEGKLVIITGSRRGIGNACVDSFIDAGACVVGCAKGPDDEHTLTETIQFTKLPNKYFYKRCDVSIPNEIEEFINWVVEKFGKIDCLINNAGIHPPTLSIDEFTHEDFQKLLSINLISIFVACKSALPHIRSVKGSIINMGSAVGKYGQEGASIYCASKGAISAFTKALAIDEGKYGVRVNAILPGAILTPSALEWASVFEDPEEKLKEIDRWSWLNRQGKPSEVGEAAVFLACSMSNYITGHELLVTGGTELGYGIKQLVD